MTPNIRRQYYYYRTSFYQLESRLVLSAIGFAAQELIASEANGGLRIHPNVGGPKPYVDSFPISLLDDWFLSTWKAVDFDGDTDLDLLVAGWDIYWLENLDGAFAFSEPQQLINFVQLIAPFDNDGDGDLDLLVSGEG